MDEFSKMVAEIGGEQGEAYVGDTPGAEGTQQPDLKQRLRERMAKARAAKHPKVSPPLGGARGIDPRLSAIAKERWRKRKEAEANGRTGKMQESGVSQSGGGTAAAGPGEVRGNDAGHGVSPNGVSDLSQSAGMEHSGLSEVEQISSPAGAGLQPQLTPDQQEMLRSAVIAYQQPFHINVAFFNQALLEQAQHALNELRAQTAGLAATVEDRRQRESGDDLRHCTWCKKPFDAQQPFFGLHQFEVGGVGSGQWRAVTTCRNANCIEKFNNAVERIQRDQRAERTV